MFVYLFYIFWISLEIFSEVPSRTYGYKRIYFLEINCSEFPAPNQRDRYFMFFLQGVTFPCIFLWNIDNTTVCTNNYKRLKMSASCFQTWGDLNEKVHVYWKNVGYQGQTFTYNVKNTILLKVLWFFSLYNTQPSTVLVWTFIKVKRLFILWK